MSKLQELIKEYGLDYNRKYRDGTIEKVIKRYVKICLEKAAKEARTDCYIKQNRKGSRYKKWQDNVEFDLFDTIQMYKVNKESITNIELP